MDKIRVAIIGVGNCASSLIQGVEYYKNTKDTDFVPGIMHVNLKKGGFDKSNPYRRQIIPLQQSESQQ